MAPFSIANYRIGFASPKVKTTAASLQDDVIVQNCSLALVTLALHRGVTLTRYYTVLEKAADRERGCS